MSNYMPRQPAGVPTGGQFAARGRSESTITLGGPPAQKSLRSTPTPAANEALPTVPTLGDRFDDITDQIIYSKMADKAGEGFDKVADTFEAAGASFSAARNAPVSEEDGSFVGWGQMVPKFLRRKEK